MKRLIAFLISYALVFSPVMAKDIVAPRDNEDINFITKPGGVNITSLKINGTTGGVDFPSPSSQIFNVGDIKQSILTEAQFQSIHGTGWVKFKGQTITGSKLCIDYFICALPNAEGRFLRDSVSDASLGTPVDDTTAKNGLSNGTSLVTGGSISVSGTRTAAAQVHSGGSSTASTSGAGAHNHGLTAGGTYVRRNPAAGLQYGSGGDYYNTSTWADAPNHTHPVTGISHPSNLSSTVTGGTWTLAGTRTAAAQVISGDTETAPNHLVVNTFIKIN